MAVKGKKMNKQVECLMTQAKIGYGDAYILMFQNKDNENVVFEALLKSDESGYVLIKKDEFKRFGIGEYYSINLEINDEGQLFTKDPIRAYQKHVKMLSDADSNMRLLESLNENFVIV